nr:long chain acyl-CoA synthetase 6, peroxisomal-like [Tanacetum cinerariifolium]
MMAAYMINRYPSTALEKKTHMDLWLGHPANYEMLRIFGCVAYSHLNQGKLKPRAIKCISLGYLDGVKGYILWRGLGCMACVGVSEKGERCLPHGFLSAIAVEKEEEKGQKVNGIHVDKTKVNADWDWTSPKTLPEELYITDEYFRNSWMDLETKQHREQERTTLHDILVYVVETYEDNKDLRIQFGADGIVRECKWMTYREACIARLEVGSDLLYHGIPKGSTRLYFNNRPEWVIVDNTYFAYSYISVLLYDTIGGSEVDFEVLKGTADVGLVYCRDQRKHVDVDGFVDPDYAKDPNKGRSITGNEMFHKRIKHINVRYHFMREIVMSKETGVAKIGTKDNAAGTFIKVVLEEPKPLAGHEDQFDAHPNPQPGNMNGWVDDDDDDVEEEEDEENEDADMEEDDDAVIIFPYEVQGDQTPPPRDESSDSDSEPEAEDADDEPEAENADDELEVFMRQESLLLLVTHSS